MTKAPYLLKNAWWLDRPSPLQLAKRVLTMEHQLYPKAIGEYLKRQMAQWKWTITNFN